MFKTNAKKEKKQQDREINTPWILSNDFSSQFKFLKKNLCHYIWIQWKICFISVKNVPIGWKGRPGKAQLNTATSDFCATWAHCEILYIIHWALSHGHILAYKSLQKLEPPKCRVSMRHWKHVSQVQMCEIWQPFVNQRCAERNEKQSFFPTSGVQTACLPSPFLPVFQLKYWEDTVETLLDLFLFLPWSHQAEI